MSGPVPSVLLGLFIGLAGALTWSRLVVANTRSLSAIPWAVVVMAPLLALWWHYFARGRGWPRRTAEVRKLLGRANRVPDHLWGPALGAGMLGLMSTLLLQGVLARLVTLPQQRDLDPSQYPLFTVFSWLVMSAAVSGVVEETAARGYIQGGIERRYGIAPAILLTGMLFGASHFTHPEVGIVLLPFYIAVSAVYGLLASATNSIYPSMVLHGGGNLFSAFGLVVQGRSEWAPSAAPAPTIWETGPDGPFFVTLGALAIMGVATVMAYRGLFRLARSQ
ncbi:MAG: CPBP family intramembrane metalloprotease [Gemmatimonadaceae bacterium]|nr:CPBP family intramembrane metalloprotease [Gemmatimonadaceae bacterium]